MSIKSLTSPTSVIASVVTYMASGSLSSLSNISSWWLQAPALALMAFVLITLLTVTMPAKDAALAAKDAAHQIVVTQMQATMASMQTSFMDTLEKQRVSFMHTLAAQDKSSASMMEQMAAARIKQLDEQRIAFLNQLDKQRHDCRGEINGLLLLLAGAYESPANKKLADEIRTRQREIDINEAVAQAEERKRTTG